MDMHDRFRAMAIKNLAPRSKGGKGVEVTLKKMVAGEYNPDTSMVEDDSVVEYFGSALRTSFKTFAIDGNLIRVDDLLLYLSPQLINGTDCPAPIKGDTIVFSGVEYVVHALREWDFAGVECGWRVQLRLGS